jgi:tRNA(fMet)-specific endonuclease VapC
MIVDTNIYTAVRKGNALVSDTLAREAVIHMPVPVIAELKKGFMLGTMLDRNTNDLNIFLARDNCIVLDCDIDTTQHYAELSSYAQKSGRALSNNDLWIAALAVQHNVPLLTLDKDFEAILHLLPKGSRVIVE